MRLISPLVSFSGSQEFVKQQSVVDKALDDRLHKVYVTSEDPEVSSTTQSHLNAIYKNSNLISLALF